MYSILFMIMEHALLPPHPTERIALLEQRPGLIWEGSGVSNPGVARLPDGTIAMVYRGCGSDNIGHLGYCRLDDEGRYVIHGSRSRHPLNIPSKNEKEEFPGGYGDPRVNKVGAWYYIWANARNNEQMKVNRERYSNDFAGQYMGGRQTVAFRTKDFKSVEYLGLHGPDEFDKNSFLHPTPVAINGTPYWAFIHRVQYSIQVRLTPSLEYLKNRKPWHEHIEHLDSFTMMTPKLRWEGVGSTDNWPGSISGGAPPLAVSTHMLPRSYDQSQSYWLMFYNASGDAREGKIARDRRIGAIVYTLKEDLNLQSQPFRVVARTPRPILLPIEPYELNSPNGDVVFATGAVKTIDGEGVDLFYGSGDAIVSKARFNLKQLLNYVCQFNEHGELAKDL